MWHDRPLMIVRTEQTPPPRPRLAVFSTRATASWMLSLGLRSMDEYGMAMPVPEPRLVWLPWQEKTRRMRSVRALAVARLIALRPSACYWNAIAQILLSWLPSRRVL